MTASVEDIPPVTEQITYDVIYIKGGSSPLDSSSRARCTLFISNFR